MHISICAQTHELCWKISDAQLSYGHDFVELAHTQIEIKGWIRACTHTVVAFCAFNTHLIYTHDDCPWFTRLFHLCLFYTTALRLYLISIVVALNMCITRRIRLLKKTLSTCDKHQISKQRTYFRYHVSSGCGVELESLYSTARMNLHNELCIPFQ